MARGARAGNHGRGSHWIRDEKRIRIYERDSWKCVWCGCAVASVSRKYARDAVGGSVRLATLDHVLPRTRGGSNHHGNLVTSCSECNEARGERSAIEFAFALQTQDELEGALLAAEMLDRVIEAMGRELPPAAPKRKPPKEAA